MTIPVRNKERTNTKDSRPIMKQSQQSLSRTFCDSEINNILQRQQERTGSCWALYNDIDEAKRRHRRLHLIVTVSDNAHIR